jgi:hypothetical protein
MATTTILHIGEDLCQRIPVMEAAGFVVFQSDCFVLAVQSAFAREEEYSAIIFHNDFAAIPENTVHEARDLSEAPLILFQNPTIDCNDGDFDLVVPALTPPDIWLEKLREVIQAARETGQRSARLREDCGAARSRRKELRQRTVGNRVSPISPDALWRGDDDAGSLPDPKPPEESRPPGRREKAG